MLSLFAHTVNFCIQIVTYDAFILNLRSRRADAVFICCLRRLAMLGVSCVSHEIRPVKRGKPSISAFSVGAFSPHSKLSFALRPFCSTANDQRDCKLAAIANRYPTDAISHRLQGGCDAGGRGTCDFFRGGDGKYSQSPNYVHIRRCSDELVQTTYTYHR